MAERKAARRGQSPVTPGGEPALVSPVAKPSVVVAIRNGQEVRVGLAQIKTPTLKELQSIDISDNGNPYPLAVEMLMMFGQIEIVRGEFVVRSNPVVKVPGPETVVDLVARLRKAKINYVFGRSEANHEISVEEMRGRRRDGDLLTKVLTMLGQADVARQVKPDESEKCTDYDERFHRPSDRPPRTPNSSFFDGQVY